MFEMRHDQDCPVINSPRLEDALQIQFTKEKMVGSEQYFCSSSSLVLSFISRCNRKCDAEVLTKIKRLPSVLVLRLQRLQYDRGSGNQMKLTNGVQIPLAFDFANFSNLVYFFLDHDLQDPSVTVSDYVLVAAIHHHGDQATRGHYTCHVQYRCVLYII